MPTKITGFRLEDDEKSKLAEMALLNNCTMSEMIRALINNAYNSDEVREHITNTLKVQKAMDVLKSAGLDTTSYNVHYDDGLKMPGWRKSNRAADMDTIILSERESYIKEIANESLEKLWEEFDNER